MSLSSFSSSLRFSAVRCFLRSASLFMDSGKSLRGCKMLTAAHTHTHAHTQAQAHTHMHTHTQAQEHTHTHAHTHTSTSTHTHMHTHIHTSTSTHTHMHTYKHKHTHAHTPHIHTHAHTKAQAHTHTCTHTHTSTSTHTHTHAHTYHKREDRGIHRYDFGKDRMIRVSWLIPPFAKCFRVLVSWHLCRPDPLIHHWHSFALLCSVLWHTESLFRSWRESKLIGCISWILKCKPRNLRLFSELFHKLQGLWHFWGKKLIILKFYLWTFCLCSFWKVKMMWLCCWTSDTAKCLSRWNLILFFKIYTADSSMRIFFAQTKKEKTVWMLLKSSSSTLNQPVWKRVDCDHSDDDPKLFGLTTVVWYLHKCSNFLRN